MSSNRLCCDGLCLQGRSCPLASCARLGAADGFRLAPGVLDGPYTARRPIRLLHRLVAALKPGSSQPADPKHP